MSLQEAIDTLNLIDTLRADAAQDELDSIIEEKEQWKSDYQELEKERDELIEDRDKFYTLLESIQDLTSEVI